MNIKKMSLFKKSIVASAVSLGLGLGVAGNAQADAYAIAYDNITNLVINPIGTPGAITLTLPSSINSSSKACLPNVNCVTGGGAGSVNAAPSQVGAIAPAYTPDTFISAAGQTAQAAGIAGRELNANSFSLADAQIASQQTVGNPFTQAINMAEGLLRETNTASAQAGNSSGTVLTVGITVANDAALDFSFDADPFIKARLDAGAVPTSQAEGIIAVSFSIIDNLTGLSVFNWTPDGTSGGISGVGAAELLDPFTLNTSRTRLPGAPGTFVYDPTGCDLTTLAGCFHATTGVLAAGGYTLNIAMSEQTNLQLTTVPEPGTLALLGAGLFGAFRFSERRTKKSAV